LSAGSTYFWSKSFQRHPNSATGIAAVTLTAPHPARHAEFLKRFSGAGHESLSDGSMRFALDGGRIEVVPAAEVQARSLPSPSLASFSVRVDEIETVAKLLREEEILFLLHLKGLSRSRPCSSAWN
jgi:hypothetical protein